MANTLFLECRKKFNIQDIDFSLLDNLVNKEKIKSISIASTIQYINLIPLIKKYFQNLNVQVLLKKGPIYLGQVLGCNPQAFNLKADFLLLLADGKFHALNNAVILNRPIYVFNTKEINLFSQEEINKHNQRILANKKIFLSSDKVGFLISTKKGQNYKNSKNIIDKIKKLNKTVYLFESDNLSLNELENFPLPLYINSACPGLEFDASKVINLSQILEFI